MSKLLKKHQKKEFRYEGKDFKLYELADIQREELAKMLSEGSKIENNELVGEFGLKTIRYIIKELTNIGEEINEYSDIELESLLDNGDRELQLLIREIESLLHEVAEDVLYQTTKSIKLMNDLLNTLDVDNNAEKLSKKWDKFNKKYKMNISWEELVHNANKREELENKIKEVK